MLNIGFHRCWSGIFRFTPNINKAIALIIDHTSLIFTFEILGLTLRCCPNIKVWQYQYGMKVWSPGLILDTNQPILLPPLVSDVKWELVFLILVTMAAPSSICFCWCSNLISICLNKSLHLWLIWDLNLTVLKSSLVCVPIFFKGVFPCSLSGNHTQQDGQKLPSSLRRFSQIWLYTRYEVQIFNQHHIFMDTENQMWKSGNFYSFFSFYQLLTLENLQNTSFSNFLFSVSLLGEI